MDRPDASRGGNDFPHLNEHLDETAARNRGKTAVCPHALRKGLCSTFGLAREFTGQEIR
jgi:hypothetical protein